MDSIKIGPMIYKIIEIADLCIDGDTMIGSVCHTSGELLLEMRLCPQAKKVTLWHEIIHAILVTSGNVGEHDDRLVDALAYGIVSVLDDNPQLSAYDGRSE